MHNHRIFRVGARLHNHGSPSASRENGIAPRSAQKLGITIKVLTERGPGVNGLPSILCSSDTICTDIHSEINQFFNDIPVKLRQKTCPGIFQSRHKMVVNICEVMEWDPHTG